MSPFWPISHLLGILSQVMQTGWQPQSLNLSPEIQGENQLTGFHEELGASSKKYLSGVPGAHCDAALQVTSLGLALGPGLEHLHPAFPACTQPRDPHSSENYKAALDEPRGPCAQSLSFL